MRIKLRGQEIIETTEDNLLNDNRYEAIKEAVTNVVGGHFRPEFINSIDELVVFHPLGQSQIAGIASIQLDRLKARLRDRDLTLEVSDELLSLIAEAGYDPVYGARPLKRAIQQLIENPLSQDVLSGRFIEGDTILGGVDGDRAVFSKQ